MRELKRVAIMLLALISVFALLDVAAYAVPPSNPHIESGTAADGGNFFEFDASYLGESGWRDLKTPPHWVVETGEVAYCLDHMADSPHNVAYGEFDPHAVYSESTYKGLLAIMEHSYPYRNAGLTDQQIKYATSNAIRSWLRESAGIGYDFMLPSNNAVRPKGSAGQSTYNFYMQLLDKARNGSVIPHYVNTRPEIIEMHVENNMLVGQVSIECGYLSGGYQINEDVLPEGVSITGYTGENWDALTVSAPIEMVGASINISDVFIGYDNRSAANIYWLDDSGGKQSVAVPVVDRMVTVTTGDLSFKSDASTVTVIKYGESEDTLLEGAVFGLYSSSDDALLEEMVTDINGQAVSGNLLIGNYYIKEITAPEGYVLSGVTYPFSITDTNQDIGIPVYNDPIKGKVSVLKTGEGNNPLQDVLFCIYDTSDNFVQEIITNEQGEATSKYLDYGDYYIKEVSAPEGYILNDENIPFSISENEETVEITITNTIIRGKLKVTKKDEEGNLLEGVVFCIYDMNDILVEELTTNAEGEAISSDLIYGEYYFKETSTIEGYVLNDEPVSFNIYEDGGIIEVELVNEKIYGQVKIIKSDNDTGAFLDGAVFELYNSQNELIETLNTDSNGYAVSNALEYGEYSIKEVRAPEGYVLNNESCAFTIVSDEETITLDITNDPIKGKVEVIKTDSETGKLLSGAVFGIYNEDDNLIQELVTDENGYLISSSLLYGQYYLKEISAPEGYILGDEIYPFSIETNNQIIHFDISNEIIKGRVEIIKTEPIHGSPLAGVKFSVYGRDDNLVEELITDENGKAVSSDLVYGDYYVQESEPINGYISNETQYRFNIGDNGEIINIAVQNTPVSGSVEVYFRHTDYGHELYDSYVYSDWVGMPYMGWVKNEGLVDRDIDGFTLVKADYPDSQKLIEGKLTITYWYEEEPVEGGWTEVAIPKTGQRYPKASYLAGIFCFIIAILIMGFSYNSVKKVKRDENSKGR